MRPLEPPFSTLPPLAKEYALAWVRVPGLGSDFGPEAAHLLSDLTYGQPVALRVHGKDPLSGVPQVAVYADDYTGTHCANEELLTAGLARLSAKETRRLKRRLGGTGPSAVAAAAAAGDADAALLARLEAAQAAAKKGRKGMFRYGDVGDSEDEFDARGGRPGGAWGAGGAARR